MRMLARLLVILSVPVVIFACSPGVEDVESNNAPKERESSPVAAQDIDGFMGFNWGDGIDALPDRLMFDVESLADSEVYSSRGGTHYLEGYGVEVDYEVYEFSGGKFVSGEVGGNKAEDMETMRGRLTEEYGQPEAIEGLYTWASSTGTITLEDQEGYWRLTAWSSDAPSY